MKLNVTVDLDDLYTEDSEGSIAESVKQALVNEIVYEVQRKVREQIEGMLDACIRQTISDKIGEITNKVMLDKFDENAEVVIDKYRNEKMPIKDYVSKTFSECISKYSMSDALKRECERICNELRKRYDMQFAALIVDNLRKQNLLSDDRIAELLKTD